MKPENEYRHFLSTELPQLILDGVLICFNKMDVDPEVAWSEFRKGLRKIKKRHEELYLAYGESDAEDEPRPEREIDKWRREHENKRSIK